MKTKLILLLVAIVFSLSLHAQNTITMVNPPSSVTAGANVTFTINYTKAATEASAIVIVRFKSNVAPYGNLNQQSKVVTANSGNGITLTVVAPSTVGSGYRIEAQMIKMTYQNLATQLKTGVSVVNAPGGQNTLEIVNTSNAAVNLGDTKVVNVKYNVLQSSKILVEIYKTTSASSTSDRIGMVSTIVPAGSGTVPLNLQVYANGTGSISGLPGASNRIQARLYKADGSATISIPTIPYLLVNKGDGTITYRGAVSQGINEHFRESLGNDYYTNYYLTPGWAGPIKMKFGQNGASSYVEYQNDNTSTEGHREFDIKIQKFYWNNGSALIGYPKQIKDIGTLAPTTMSGQWSSGSGGKANINMTGWISRTSDFGGDRCDIIVHAFDNSGKFRTKYDNNTTSGGHSFNNLGEIVSGGKTYQVLITLPGYAGETASYNLIPDSIVQQDPLANYSTAVINSTIDMKDIINKLIAKEAAYPGVKITMNNTWQVAGLEWTVVGQTPAYDNVLQKMIPGGHGKFTFNSYFIPNLNNTTASKMGISNKNNTLESSSTNDEIVNSELKNVTIFPNPCTDSFTYKFDNMLSNSVNIDLFSIDGKKINIRQNGDALNNNVGTVNTTNLNSGTYFVRFATDNTVETVKLLKN